MEVVCAAAVFVKTKGVQDASTERTLQLTRLDQMRNYYNRSVLFYPGNKGDGERGDVEEEGGYNAAVLEAVRYGVEAMVEHYPWAAGRLRVVKQLYTSPDGKEEEQECLEVCINADGGPGVQFVGARVNCPLYSFGDLCDPNPAFEPLFASIDKSAPYPSRPLVSFQVSIFECGGFCVSMSSNHVLFDGWSASMFLNNTGSCARKKGVCFPLDLAPRILRIYPNKPPNPTFSCPLHYMHKKDVKLPLTTKQKLFSTQLLTTKLVYTQHDIATLRSHALSKQEDCKNGFQTCSRFQVMSAHLWRVKARCLIALHEDPLQQFILYTGVNVREHVVPSIPRSYVGNAVGVVTPSASLKDLTEKSLAFVVEIIQHAIRDMTLERFQSDVDHIEILGGNACMTPSFMVVPSMVVPSLANLGFYDVDFGWGKPTHFARHFEQSYNFFRIVDGDSQCTSFSIFAVFISQDELRIFQDGLKWEVAHQYHL